MSEAVWSLLLAILITVPLMAFIVGFAMIFAYGPTLYRNHSQRKVLKDMRRSAGWILKDEYRGKRDDMFFWLLPEKPGLRGFVVKNGEKTFVKRDREIYGEVIKKETIEW